MKTRNIIFILLASVLAGCQQTYELKEHVQTTFQEPWTIVPTSDTEGGAASSLVIHTDSTLQTVDGFGSCFNEQGWASLSVLSEEQRDSIMTELFKPGAGANFVMGRMPIGANDFSLDYYSYDETDGDFEMKDFSIEHDKGTLIPFIKWALAKNPDLKLWASPWCPPKWMKKTKCYAECSDKIFNANVEKVKEAWKTAPDPLMARLEYQTNDTPLDKMGYEGITSFFMQDEYLKAYALYFGKFVDAYRNEGINIFMVMPQNEPNSAQVFPSCCWTAEDLNKFVGEYLGPELEKHDVDLYFGTIERPDPMKVDTLLKDPRSSKYIKGCGFQWAGKDALPAIHQNYPDMTLMGTEQECGNGLNNWEHAMHAWDLMRHYFKSGANSYFYWNTSLFENRASRWGWHQNSLVTINDSAKTYKYTPEYYVMKHASHYVMPGARLLAIGGNYDDAIAFLNPDNSVIALVGNQDDDARTLTVSINGQEQNVPVASHSVNTYVFKSR